MRRTIGIVALVCIVASFCFADADEDSKKNEIKRARKELLQLQTERKKNRLETDKDQKNFKAYTTRTAERFAMIKNETDSINGQITVQKSRNDSLAALVNSANARIRQYEMSQETLRKKLLVTCDQLTIHLKDLPPMVRQNLVASAALLKNELRNKSVGNVEAFNRIQQIMARAEETTGSIQVSQESSPVAEIRGMVYRLRIGAFFEAVVNLKGEECAVWYASDSTGWRTIEDPSIAGEILKAANIREGKTMPSFVNLPLVADKMKGGEQ